MVTLKSTLGRFRNSQLVLGHHLPIKTSHEREKEEESLMKKGALCPWVALALILCLYASMTFGQQRKPQKHCDTYSDSFNTYDIRRWKEVFLYSKAQGKVSVDTGHLVLEAPEERPTEVQVYALFTFDGDFDIQTDYDVSDQSEPSNCRFNAGIVMQTLGDERSYKCYVARSPQKELFFRSRLDLFGEKNVEKHKGPPAQKRGTIRIVRKHHLLTFFAMKDKKWIEIYAFKAPSKEKLRLRYKLQTSDEEAVKWACPTVVSFDNFIVNSCDIILQE